MVKIGFPLNSFSSSILALYVFDKMPLMDFSYYSHVSLMYLDSLHEPNVFYNEFFQIHVGS